MSALDAVVAHVAQAAGIDVARGGQLDALRRFVERRRREVGLASPDAYASALPELGAGELARAIDAVAVGTTWLLRDAGQLALAASLLAAARPPARAWVPGCSTGEDAWGLAAHAAAAGVAVEILGTDVRAAAIAAARAGAIAPPADALPDPIAAAFVRRDAALEPIESIRAAVRFDRHNLLDPPPERGWDLVLCRNVLMYFEPVRRARVLAALVDSLAPGGALLLGAAESQLAPPRGARVERVAVGARADRVLCRGTSPDPRSPAADPLATAMARLARGDGPAARSAARQAVTRDPTSADAHFALGLALRLCGDASAAAAALARAFALDAALWPAAYYLARCYEALDRETDARDALERAKRAAERPDARAGLVDLEEWRPLLVRSAGRAGPEETP